jgi:transcriptional antiterminator RfaH
VLIRLQWHAARWAPGTLGLIMDGERPARVPDAVIAEIRARERNGAVELPPRPDPGDRVTVLRGPFRDRPALYAGMSGPDRIAVLLHLLGREHKVLLPRIDVEI